MVLDEDRLKEEIADLKSQIKIIQQEKQRTNGNVPSPIGGRGGTHLQPFKQAKPLDKAKAITILNWLARSRRMLSAI
jgi:hypothetical protein